MSAPASHPAPAPPPQNPKTALRRSLLAARRTASPDAGADASRCAALLDIPEVAAAGVVAGYTALPGEPDIVGALDVLSARGVRVLLPVVTDTRDLEFVDAAGQTVDCTEIDVVLAPAVAADRLGGRLGRGGGSYDRALVRIRPETLVIAIVHATELVPAVPVEPHDRPVGAVLAGDQLIRVPR